MRAAVAALLGLLATAAAAPAQDSAALEAENDRLAGLVLEHLLRGHARVIAVAAVVLGHELAHLILWSGGTKRAEAEADYLGLYLAARAGFDVSVAPPFWERMGRENPFSSIDWGFYAHPTSASRQLELRATVAEIDAKRAAGQPLDVPKAFAGLERLQEKRVDRPAARRDLRQGGRRSWSSRSCPGLRRPPGSRRVTASRA